MEREFAGQFVDDVNTNSPKEYDEEFESDMQSAVQDGDSPQSELQSQTYEVAIEDRDEVADPTSSKRLRV